METNEFTAVETAVIRNTVEDWAAVYYGGPFDFGEASAVRYVTDGHLEALCATHGRDVVWQAVADRIAADRSVLELTREQRQERETARHERAGQLVTDARGAFMAGDYGRAHALVDEAELIDPAYRTPRGVTFERIREEIQAAQATTPDAEPTPETRS